MTGEELREWRHKQGLTQERLAERLGYERTIIWRWERGERLIPRWLPLALDTIAEDLENEKREWRESQKE